MDQNSTSRRKSPFNTAVAQEATTAAGSACCYLRVDANTANPGRALHRQRVVLAPGGMLDVVVDCHGGGGMGNVAYSPGLVAAVKRGPRAFVYRFEIPSASAEGTVYDIAVHGNDSVPAFRFVLQVGAKGT